MMRYRYIYKALGLFLALGFVFSFNTESLAQSPPIPANEVTLPGSEQQITSFLSYAVAEFNRINTTFTGPERDTELIKLNRSFSNDEQYKNDDVYITTISQNGYLSTFSQYPRLYGYYFDSDKDSTITATLSDLFSFSTVNAPLCRTYMYNDNDRVACAQKAASPGGEITLIAGLHHGADDHPFIVPEVCESLDIHTRAKDVETEPNLQDYVQQTIEEVQKFVRKQSEEITQADIRLKQEQVYGRLLGIQACFSAEPLRYKDIYLFIMGSDQAGTVVVNGLRPELNGLNLEVRDTELPGEGDEQKISTLFRNALTCESGEEPAVGDKAKVYYRWDDPTEDTDDLDTNDGTTVPGSSDKIGYIEVANLFALTDLPAGDFIFGSGIYPEGETQKPEKHYDCLKEESKPKETAATEDDDDGGCAIAGTGHTSQDALLNLFLTASLLFSVVFLRRRM